MGDNNYITTGMQEALLPLNSHFRSIICKTSMDVLFTFQPKCPLPQQLTGSGNQVGLKDNDPEIPTDVGWRIRMTDQIPLLYALNRLLHDAETNGLRLKSPAPNAYFHFQHRQFGASVLWFIL